MEASNPWSSQLDTTNQSYRVRAELAFTKMAQIKNHPHREQLATQETSAAALELQDMGHSLAQDVEETWKTGRWMEGNLP